MSQPTKGIKPEIVTAEKASLIKEATSLVRRYLGNKRQLDRNETARKSEIDRVNKKFAKKAETKLEDQRRISNRLYEIAKILIPGNEKPRFFHLTTGKLSFKKSPDKLEVTDETAAKARIADEGWSEDCVKVERKIVLPALKKRLSSDGRRRRMRGTTWVEGEDLSYINDSVKLDEETQTGEGHDEEVD